MARLFYREDRFDEIARSSIAEQDFQSIIQMQAEFLFPDHFVVPFEHAVDSEYGSAKPDFAIIHSTYVRWWVVEVEMSDHPLTGHVLPQVRILANAEYTEDAATYLQTRCGALDFARLRDLMKGEQPNVLVISNEANSEWPDRLHGLGALVMTIRIFKSSLDKFAYLIEGDNLPQISQMESDCIVDKTIPRFLRVSSPAVLPPTTDAPVRIYIDNGLTEWQRIDVRDTVWLNPTGANPLDPKAKYTLVRDNLGGLRLKRASRHPRVTESRR